MDRIYNGLVYIDVRILFESVEYVEAVTLQEATGPGAAIGMEGPDIPQSSPTMILTISPSLTIQITWGQFSLLTTSFIPTPAVPSS